MKFKRILKSAAYLSVAIGVSSALAGSYEDWFRAVNNDDAGAVQSLIQRGFDPNTRDEKGQTALYLALRGDDFKVADVLLRAPQLDVDAANPAGETALMMAALRGRTDWEARLLARGARLQREGWSPVLYAASGPEPQALSLLLDRGAPVDARSPNGTTPLMMAARYGSPDSVQVLLDHGADPKLRNDLSLSAADFAQQGGRPQLQQKLAALAR
jgi:ankyrin repeat protein